MLHVCQPGYESFLAKELSAPEGKGPGWARGEGADLCFAHWSLEGERALKAPSARGLAGALADLFLETSRGESYESPWPLVIEGGAGEGAEKRAHTVEELFLEGLKKRMSRVAKLAKKGRPGPGPARGLFAYLPELGRAFAARDAVFGGQKRMADDPRAPSRSYLKVEEAYGVLGAAPAAGELVVDLGAAPGGWSYSAAQRGASVIAVDNGPLKGGALRPEIEHRAEDAFRFAPRPCDWLLCDMLEDPARVLGLLEAWLDAGACRRFVFVLKFGRLDPLPLLRRARAFSPRLSTLKARHLFHNREEFALVGAR